MTYEETGQRIKARRKELKMSAAVLADRLGLSKATIHRYENGDIKNIKMPVLESLSEVLMVNPSWLIGKTDIKDATDDFDVCIAIENFIRRLKTYDNIVCKGVPVSSKSRQYLITALEILRNALEA